ncbi:MAG: hypothetical protein IKA11_02850 [Clostridia bacterium]|nr:hypothetical protein [Clostridia bacterium]
MITDIHAHVLPFVDDGSETLEHSLEMLGELYSQGVTDVILTPHFRGDYVKTPEELYNVFKEFKARCYEADIPVNLYLGQEVFIDGNYKKIFHDKKVLTLNGTPYVLIEFAFENAGDITEFVYELKNLGYVPIVAHLERYTFSDIDLAYEIKAIGGLIQVNADSIVGKYKRKYSKFIKELFSENLVDFVSSDLHHKRKLMIKKAKDVIVKKYGEECAEKVFRLNTEKIIKG